MRLRALVSVLLASMAPLLLSACSVGTAARRASQGAFEGAESWWASGGKEKVKAEIQSQAAQAAAKPAEERTAWDWILILLAGGSTTGGVWVVLQRLLLGTRDSAAGAIAAEVTKLLATKGT